MTDALTHFPPNRTEALTRLRAFLPKCGKTYAARRNYDMGPGAHKDVSTLSPYIRTRLLTEEEVLQAVLARYSVSTAEKFIQEVFWRTYWKGWLEMRPAVWRSYQRDLRHALNDVQTQSGLRNEWQAACKGETGIDCFDAWAKELVQTGYLHNHARMWFASIWIFTLRLPWELGADLFLRHLLDGDPASNTLSWRWVAGLQTPGKTYLARTSNISKFTEGRFHPKWQLATSAPALNGPAAPTPEPLASLALADAGRRTGFILHAEDLLPGAVMSQLDIASVAVLRAEEALSPLKMAPHLGAFLDGALADTLGRHQITSDVASSDTDTLADWARNQGLDQIVTAYAPVGPVADQLAALDAQLDIPVIRVRRAYDTACWPRATHGFFRFKEHIPQILDDLFDVASA